MFDGATVVTPAGKLLARQLSLVVRPQHSLLITGPNGSGALLPSIRLIGCCTSSFSVTHGHLPLMLMTTRSRLQASPASSECCISSGHCQMAASAAPQPQTEVR